jgi:phosphoribosylformimino-5-aminoimidazole carboxamide ribonucleotide (ProFAR) isomerase
MAMEFLEVDVPEGFELIPSLAVMGATPVLVRDNRYSPIQIGDSKPGVISLARSLSEKFGTIHYLDILGIRRGIVEWNLFQEVVDKSSDIWADVGITFSDGLIDVIMAGASNAVITTKMIDSISEIVSSFELTENLVLQLDHDGAVISKDKAIRDMTAGELVGEMASFGMERFILDDIKEGRRGMDLDLLSEISEKLPENGRLYIGIEELEELKELFDAGVGGAIISCSKLIEGIR